MIKPCTCGHWPEIQQTPASGLYFLICPKCGKETKLYIDLQPAVEAWNRKVHIDIDKCPYCGSTKGLYSKYVLRGIRHYGFDGSYGIILNTNISDDHAEGYVRAAKDIIEIIEKGGIE